MTCHLKRFVLQVQRPITVDKSIIAITWMKQVILREIGHASCMYQQVTSNNQPIKAPIEDKSMKKSYTINKDNADH